MEMSEYAIFRSWKESKHPKAQIKILAELNDTKPIKIHEIINRQQFYENESKRVKEVHIEAPKKAKNVDFTQSEGTLTTYEEIVDRLEFLDALISRYSKEYSILAQKLGGGI